VLRKYVTVAVAIVVAYLFIQLLRQPLPSPAHTSWQNFWPAVDVALAVAISWVPVAGDYARHSRSPRTAFGAAFVGYTVTQTACYALGIIAILSVWGAFIAVALGKLAFAVLAIREIDQSFCDVYSTAVSTQNLRPQWDRRVLALIVGTGATLLALLFHIGNYQNFLYLIGSVFVPLFAVAAVDFFLVSRQRWDVSEHSRLRVVPVVAWACGFVAYQLVYPGDVAGWSDFWSAAAGAIGFAAPVWLGSSVAAIGVGGLVMLVLGWIVRSAVTRRTHDRSR
jgi:purine-cytosine permease-like protein